MQQVDNLHSSITPPKQGWGERNLKKEEGKPNRSEIVSNGEKFTPNLKDTPIKCNPLRPNLQVHPGLASFKCNVPTRSTHQIVFLFRPTLFRSTLFRDTLHKGTFYLGPPNLSPSYLDLPFDRSFYLGPILQVLPFRPMLIG
jgi:hypothetical protein